MTSKNKNEPTKPEDTPEQLTDAPQKASAESPQSPVNADVAESDKRAKRAVKLGSVAIIIALLFGGASFYTLQQQTAQYQQDIAALQTQLSQTQQTLEQQLKSTEAATLTVAKTAAEKATVVLAQQQKNIESLQLAITDIKGRRPNDWLLAEADYLVKLAGRKLFLEHDIESATTLMESADQRLAALNDPSLMPLRQAMANDITKLRTLPIIDRDGIVLRLTALQSEVNALPLANAILPDAPKQVQQQVSEDISNWKQNLMTSLKDFSEHFITFRTRDGNVIPLLSPEQHFYLQENVKAKLETAIKAVYDEQPKLYQASLTMAIQWAEAYFNQDDRQVKEFVATLKQLEQVNIRVNYPTKLQSQQQLGDVIRERLRRDVTTLTSEEASL